MFESLTTRLKSSFHSLRTHGKLNTENIQKALITTREALLEADVALPVVTEFLQDLQARVLGESVLAGISPRDAFIQKAHAALTQLMGNQTRELTITSNTAPTPILLVGLQGVGKTTTTAKLAQWIKDQHKKSILLVSTDIYRPAARQQLAILAAAVGVPVYTSETNQSPSEIIQEALKIARAQSIDILLIDTAGRLQIDIPMMDELKQLHQHSQPVETLLVVDGMMGQSAAEMAKAFNEQLSITGVILTKMEGDTRGGAALSVCFMTQKPIKFIGIGEKMQALETFHPERIASRILGMGDILSVVEAIQQRTEAKTAQKITNKISKGHRFTLKDFLDQLLQMKNLENIEGLLDKLPTINTQKLAAVKNAMSPQQLGRMIAIIRAMTPKERIFPHLIQGSRKRRIAIGSGTVIQEVSRLMKQFEQMQKMLKQLGNPAKAQKLMPPTLL